MTQVYLPLIGYFILLYLALNWATSSTPFPLKKFSLFRGNSRRAKELLHQLMELISRHKQLQIESSGEGVSIPQYKFYTTILEALLHYSTQFGAPISEHLKSLRKCLIADWEFEQKLFSHLISVAVQMIALSAMTWFFGLFCQWMLELWPAVSDVLTIGGLQVAGGLSFGLLYRKRKMSLFRPYESCYRTLISVAILQQLELPLHEVISRCRLEDLPKEGKLGSFRTRLQELFQQCHHRGHSLRDFFMELREELDFYLEEDFKKFLQFTAKVKFLTLALFFLPAYLVFVFSLFGGLLP